MISVRRMSIVGVAVALIGASAGTAAAQTPAHDPSDRLRSVLPADVADRVLAKIAEARARQLPAAALEQRALKFAAKGVEAREIERSISEHADRMGASKGAIERGRGSAASGEEIDAGAEAMRKGVDGASVSELAKSAPSGRSLTVPLFVIGELIDRGLPSDEALRSVQERLQARAADADLERMPRDLPAAAAAGQANRGGANAPGAGAAGAAGGRGQGAGGAGAAGGARPSNVPAAGGRGSRPAGRP
jgi:hypothetical protein